jgi:predicted PurR-regulated permease PerM
MAKSSKVAIVFAVLFFITTVVFVVLWLLVDSPLRAAAVTTTTTSTTAADSSTAAPAMLMHTNGISLMRASNNLDMSLRSNSMDYKGVANGLTNVSTALSGEHGHIGNILLQMAMTIVSVAYSGADPSVITTELVTQLTPLMGLLENIPAPTELDAADRYAYKRAIRNVGLLMTRLQTTTR